MKRIPHYLKIAETLQEEILSNYKSGDRLPSEYDLCKRFDVSRYIVRQAMNRLVQVGIVKSYQGIGYFVNVVPIEIRYTMTPVTQYSKVIRDLGHIPSAKIIFKEKAVPPKNILDALHLKHGDETYRLEIVRCCDDVPLAYNVTWLPVSLFPNLFDYLNNFSSLYNIFKSKYSVNPLRMNSNLKAVHPYGCEIIYLDISANTPLLEIDSTVKDENKKIIEYTIAKYRGDLCKVSIIFD